MAGPCKVVVVTTLSARLSQHPRLRRLLANEFVRHNVLSFVGSVTVAALNYLYYPVLGRAMNVADFGEVQALNSLFLQVVIFLGIFNFVVVGVVAKYEDSDTQHRLIAELEKIAALIAFVTVAVLLAFGPWIAHFFRFHDLYPFLVLLIAVVLSVPGAFRNAYLYGKRDFAGIAKAGALMAAGKLLLGLLLVLVGWRAFGAMIGMVLAQILTLLYISRLARRHGWLRPADYRRTRLPDLALIRPELAFAGLVLATTFSFNSFLALDILAVKHWFDAHTAGLYAGVETLSRIVFFVNASVAGVLLPSVKPTEVAAENRRLLLRSAALTAALSLSVLVVFMAAPRLVIELLMGQKFLVYADLLPRLGLFTFLASFINLLFIYYLARRQIFIAWAGILGLALTLVLLNLHHGTPAAVVDTLILSAALTLGLTALLRFITHFKNPSSKLPKNIPNSAGSSS